MNRFSMLVLGGLAAILAVPASSTAAIISWEAASTDITGDSDILNTGTFLAAVNFQDSGTATTTVNGVVFTPNTTAPFNGDSNTLFYPGTGSPTLSTELTFLASSATFAFSATQRTLSVSGLDLGESYRVQLLIADARSAVAGRSILIDGVRTVTYGVPDAQSLVGTFVADATSQAITFDNGFPILNAYTVAVVPEPGSLVLLACGGLLAVAGYRRR